MCVRCGSPTGKTLAGRYCSTACKYEAANEKVKVARKIRNDNGYKCLHCGIVFIRHTTGGRKFCSKDCHEANIDLARPFKHGLITRLCVVCACEFIPTAKPQKICSAKCRSALNRQIDRDYSKRPMRNINGRMRSGIWASIKGRKAGASWQVLVGYSVSQLCEHLESKFLPGMSWDNMGEWHIDHIRPLASFVYVTYTDKDFLDAWALDNLQPLWALDNMRKGAKYATANETESPQADIWQQAA